MKQITKYPKGIYNIPVGGNEYIPYDEQLADNRWIAIRSKILERDNFKCAICGCHSSKNNPLNVHHRYYIFNAMAWDYEDNALVTLCNHCHNLVHKSLPPLQYLQTGDVLTILKLTPCIRCNGEGYFSEWRHIQSGKCFRCHGFRYEELINTNVDFEIKDYIEISEQIFDIIKQRKDNDYLDSIYQKGRNYQLGINGYKIDAKEAFKNYYIAAVNGYGKAQNNLGCLYKYGLKDFQQNYEKARRWLVYAAMQGIPQALSNLIDIFRDGLGVTRDVLIAKEWELLTCRNDDDINRIHSLRDFLKAMIDKSDIEDKKMYLSRFLQMYVKRDSVARELINKNVEKSGNEYINEIVNKLKSDDSMLLNMTKEKGVESMVTFIGEEMPLSLFVLLHGECKPKEYFSQETGFKLHSIDAMDGASAHFSQDLEVLLNEHKRRGEKLKIDQIKLRIQEYRLESTGERGFIAFYK